jgi:hypothetical protein
MVPAIVVYGFEAVLGGVAATAIGAVLFTAARWVWKG